jgi:sensor c-di-GMP phosphodiesterase-like protein
MMMLFPKKRAWVTVTALLLAIVCGALSGCLLGRSILRQRTESRLAINATKYLADLAAFVDDSHAFVAALNSLPSIPCSNDDLVSIRKMLYRSANFRDAGRMRGGRIECSADFEKQDLPPVPLVADRKRTDGIKVYSRISLYALDSGPVFLLQEGDSFVVSDPKMAEHWQMDLHQAEFAMFDTSTKLWGRASGLPTNVPGAVRNRDWQDMLGDALYATRCSPRIQTCAIVHVSFSKTLREDRGELSLYGALGALTGALSVLAFAVLKLRHRSVVSQLRRAIRKDKLQMVYQPIVDVNTGRVLEAEALARWTDETGFAVRPDIFVKIAEERGFVGELTKLVVRHALRDFGEILRSDSDFRLNINVTGSDLADAAFLPMLKHSLSEAGVMPQRLAIEITESSTARNPVAIETIRQLRAAGHSVQIDDFGTGYSSLSYLHDLAVDAIKIDQTFTHTIGTQAVTAGILPQILAMARTLNLQVIAEGIETPEQAQYFAGDANGILAQGWLFGKPVPASVFHSILAAGKPGEAVSPPHP